MQLSEWILYRKLVYDISAWIKYDIKGIIYLRTEPEICLQRIKKRERDEESKLSLQYLQGIHARHEEWIVGDCEYPVLILENSSDILLQQFQLVRGHLSEWIQRGHSEKKLAKLDPLIIQKEFLLQKEQCSS